ncbi:hypothetical protein RB595_002943 [Gaeumannomyces hyphopodioides]
MCWKVYRHPLFPRYLQCLNDAEGKCPPLSPEMAKPTVDFTALTRYEQLGGKGGATRVRFRDGPTGLHVFKGTDFRTCLTHRNDEGDKTVRHMIDCWHNSEALLLKMPPHPSIQPAPSVFVAITRPNGDDAPVVCGSLQPFYNHGDVGGAIEKSNSRHPLALKLAEIFSLGRTMWMLPRQPDMDFDEVGHPKDFVTDWEGTEDIPESWKQMVGHCLSPDPNERLDVVEVARMR